MERSITVKGTGRISVKPDLIELNMTLNAVDRDYERAAAMSEEQTEQIKAAAEKAGFDREDVKTSDFRISAEYEGVTDERGHYRNEFAGYRCTHRLSISFDFDKQRLADILSAVGTSGAQPELDIEFTVKDTDAASGELLRCAAEDARRKAEILCSASGVRLGELVSISCDWSEKRFVSGACFTIENGALDSARARKFRADIAPDDIDVSDSAVFVWNME